MTPKFNINLLFLTLLLTPVFAEVSAISEPEGYTKVTIPGAITSTKPSYVTFSLNLLCASSHVGKLTGVDHATNQLSDLSANWTTGMWAETEVPFFIRMKSGNASGRFLKITANSQNHLTVHLGVPEVKLNESGMNIEAGDQYEIFEADTLGAIFPGGSIPFKLGTTATASNADQIRLWNDENQAWVAYYYNGIEWRSVSGGKVNQNNVIVLPDRGIQVVRRGLTPLDFALMGRPLTGDVRISMGQLTPGLPSKTFVSDLSVFRATSKTLESSGLHLLFGWVKDKNSQNADIVQVWSTSSQVWLSYFHNGTQWQQVSGGTANKNETVLDPGAPMMIARKSSPSGKNAFYSENISY